MHRLLILFLFAVSTVFSQNEKINIYLLNSSESQKISLIDINQISIRDNYLVVNTKSGGDIQIRIDSVMYINFTPQNLDIELYFKQDDTQVIKLRTSEFDDMVFSYDPLSIDENSENEAAGLTFTRVSSNPFSENIEIEFRLETPGFVEASITDINGITLKKLFSNRMDRGIHLLEWNGLNSAGTKVSPGCYICSVRRDNIIISKKLIFIN